MYYCGRTFGSPSGVPGGGMTGRAVPRVSGAGCNARIDTRVTRGDHALNAMVGVLPGGVGIRSGWGAGI